MFYIKELSEVTLFDQNETNNLNSFIVFVNKQLIFIITNILLNLIFIKKLHTIIFFVVTNSF